MKIDIPKIVRPVDLGGYADEMKGKLVYVWVNPPLALRQEHYELQKEIREIAGKDELTADEESKLMAQAARMREILAELLSQGPEATRWSVEDVSELLTGTFETDPNFYPWLMGEIFTSIAEHVIRQKKS